MDFRKELLKEHSLSNTNNIAGYIGLDKTRFNQFLKLFDDKDVIVIQRASWVLSKIYDQYPALFKDQIVHLITLLKRPNSHVALRRNVLRILKEEQIPELFQADMWDYCFEIMKSKKETVACRAHAIGILTNMCIEFPDLWNECIPYLLLLEKDDSAGLRSCSRNALKQRMRFTS